MSVGQRVVAEVEKHPRRVPEVVCSLTWRDAVEVDERHRPAAAENRVPRGDVVVADRFVVSRKRRARCRVVKLA